MPITADQLLRTLAPAIDFQLAFYAGGRWDRLNTAAIQAGMPLTLPDFTTLTADVDRTTTTLQVASTAGFDTGVLCIHPGDGTSYELIAYTGKTATTFTGLTRGYDYDAESGVHAAGDVVSEWLEITDWVIGNITISQQRREQIGLWTASIGGVAYNSRILEVGNSILCLRRFRPAGGNMAVWTDWTVGFLGYIRSVTADDDAETKRSWTATVEGLEQFLAKSESNGHQLGRVDLAAGKGVSTSSVLIDPWEERLSGEYMGYPTLDGGQLVDGEMDTLWISQAIPLRYRPTTHANYLQINEVFLGPHAGERPLQWIEFYFKNPQGNNTDWKYYSVVNQATDWKQMGEDPTIPENNYITPWDKGRELDAAGTFVLLVSDRVEFERRWTLLGGYILDWREKQKGAFSLSQTGGFIAAMFAAANLEPIIWYGAVSVKPFAGHGPNWSGAPVALPSPGHSMARREPGLVTDPSADAFDHDCNNPTPGLFDKGDEQWADIDLGPLDCRTAAFLSSAEEDEITVSDTISLRASGQVMINSEIISYSARDDTNNKLLGLGRGQEGTTRADHPEDSLVRPYEVHPLNLAGPKVALDLHLIGVVEWTRREVVIDGQLITPVMWDWMISAHESPITPDHEDWDDPVNGWAAYWIRHRCTVGMGSATPATQHSLPLSPPVRARHVMLVIHEMADQGRAKMNQVRVLSHTAEALGTTGEGTETVDGALSGYFVRHMLETFGIPEDRFTMTHEGAVLTSMTTAKGVYTQVLNDILKKTGCVLIFDLDGRVEHRYNPLHPLAYIDDVAITWTRDNARSVQVEAPERFNVSQVILYARVGADQDSTIEIRYPPEPTSIGEPLEIRDLVVGSVGEALRYAQQLYNQANGPLSAIVVPVGPAEWARLGQRHLLTWDLDTEGTMLAGRNFVVESVQWTINLGNSARGEGKSWHTSIGLKEIMF